MPAPGDMGEAFIRVRVPSMPDIGTETLYLPPISNIEVAYYANLSELPTIVMGFRNNFIIDLGTTLKISLTMKRVNPKNYNDSSSDPDRWSNGKWYRHLEGILDYWQNFGRDSANNMTGGFQFTYMPSDTSLYPPITRNVFLNGSLTLQYATTYMVVQMNLTVARMQENVSEVRYVTIICHAGSEIGEGFPDREVQALADTPVRVPNPQNWGPTGYTLSGWATSDGGPKVYDINDTVTWPYSTTPYHLYAIWSGGPKLIKSWVDPGTYSFRASQEYHGSEPITSVRIIAVGGGGGAGGAAKAMRGGHATAGGGGGGGECRSEEFASIDEDTVFNIIVGDGGARGGNQTGVTGNGSDGADGESTTVSFAGYNVSVRGGGGGQGGVYGGGTSVGVIARGGVSVFTGSQGGTASGGDSGTTAQFTRGQNGYTYEPNVPANAGCGAPNSNASGRRWGGGAGGGASCCNYSFSLGGTTYNFVSVGGDAYEADNGESHSPVNGGGGGSAYGLPDTNYAQDGAPGLVVLVFY